MYNDQYMTMPTSTQPYGYPTMPNYNNYNMYPQQRITPPIQTNTNKIFVSGIDEVRTRALAPNSDYFFLDNDKPIIYQKIVDSKGQFEIKEFEIVEKKVENQTINENDYVKRSEFDALKEQISKLGVMSNGTTN